MSIPTVAEVRDRLSEARLYVEAARRDRGNHLQQMPMPIPASAPMAAWQQPPVIAPRPGSPLRRWVMNEYELWEAVG